MKIIYKSNYLVSKKIYFVFYFFIFLFTFYQSFYTYYVFNIKSSDDVLSDIAYKLKSYIYEKGGDIKLYRIGDDLIEDEKLDYAANILKTGDLIFVRRNWYLSNKIFNGFWPHIAIYFGNIKKMENFFAQDKESMDFLKENKVVRLADIIKHHIPLSCGFFKESGHMVFEATSEGVGLFDFKTTCKADYLAGIRPDMKKIDILKMILKSITYTGREYDYDFDYFDNSRLVCTELIYNSYNNSSMKKYMFFSNEYGKMVVKANDIVKRIDQIGDKYNLSENFLFYIKAVEKNRKTVFSNFDDFRETWKIKKLIAPPYL